ncbi:hypothetical protein ACLOJK_022363 [Asimina triloba]
MDIDVTVQTKLGGYAVHLFAFFQGLGIGASFAEGWEGIIIWGDAGVEHASEDENGPKWVVGAGVAAGHGIEEDHVWLGDLVEQVLGVVHGGGRIEGAEIDEFREGRDVILEVGFDDGGVDLLELLKGVAFGEEREGGRRVLAFGNYMAVWVGADCCLGRVGTEQEKTRGHGRIGFECQFATPSLQIDDTPAKMKPTKAV